MSKFIACDGVTGFNLECVSYFKVYKDDKNDKYLVVFHANYMNRDGTPAHLGTKVFDNPESRDEFLKEELGLDNTWEDKAPSRGNEERPRREGNRDFPQR